jgi:hypothetical protein
MSTDTIIINIPSLLAFCVKMNARLISQGGAILFQDLVAKSTLRVKEL